MFDTINAAFMIVALILAVIAGLWFGAILGESASETDKEGKPSKRRNFTQALRSAATTSAVRLWQWNRARTKKRAQDARRDEPRDL